jgi:predicted O-methyltransferase YrrM
MIYRKNPKDFITLIAQEHPEIHDALELAATRVRDRKQAIKRYQAAILYKIARRYGDQKDVTVVELGTRKGYSAAVIAQALPDARIFTCETNVGNAEEAAANLRLFPNVEIINMHSWNFLDKANDGRISLVFVDGDHEQVSKDMGWWVKVKEGGCMVFHDYSPLKFPAVVQAVHSVKEPPDEVYVPVYNDQGMAVLIK